MLIYSKRELTLTNDMTSLDLYLKRWRLRLYVNRTVSSCFHLTNCLANHQMEVRCGEKTIPTTANPKHLGITFDRSLTYSKHLSQLPKKVNVRCNLLRRLAGTTWGAHFDVLQKSTVALAFAPVEYYLPASVVPQCHTHRPDAALSKSLRLVSRKHPIDTNGHAASCH